ADSRNCRVPYRNCLIMCHAYNMPDVSLNNILSTINLINVIQEIVVNTRITLRQLTEAASQATGLHDFGDTPFEEALQCLIDALEREARLDDDRRAEAVRALTTTLIKRLQLAADRKKYPAIAQEVIQSPIFILGLPRTGSTNLHSLIAQCEGIRAPRIWEMYMPS